MKIVLSTRMRREAVGLCLIEFVMMLMCIFFFHQDTDVMIFALLYIFVMLTSVFGILMCCRFRLFTYVMDERDCFRAYIFKKKLCVVDKNKPIYYVKFTALLTRGVECEVVVISNQPFEYTASPLVRVFSREPKALIHSYNVKTQIAIPFNEQTKEILEIEKWHSVT